MFKAVRLGLALALPCVFVSTSSAWAQATATPPQPATQQKPADTAALPSAQSVIDKHIEAIGGRKALQAHSSVSVKGTLSIPANGMTGAVEVYAARPNKSFTKTTVAGIGDISEGFDGKTAWSMSPMTGPMIASGEELEQKAFNSNFDRTLGMADAYESMNTVEKTTFDGRPVYKLELKRKGGGTDIEFYDAQTGLKAGSIVEVKNPMGTITAQSTLSEYKKFGDIMQPTLVKQVASGTEIVLTFTTMEYDKVDPSVFELPAAIKALVK
jgi:hypothetical protein